MEKIYCRGNGEGIKNEITFREHKLRSEQVATLVVVEELGLVDLHGLVPRLIVEGNHLAPAAPHGDGAVVVTSHPLGLGIHPGYLCFVIFQEQCRVT